MGKSSTDRLNNFKEKRNAIKKAIKEKRKLLMNDLDGADSEKQISELLQLKNNEMYYSDKIKVLKKKISKEVNCETNSSETNRISH